MERKEINIGKPVTVAGVTLIPVSEISLNRWQVKHGAFCTGSIQPVSVVVVSPSDKKAFRINGEEITLGQLIREIPEMKEILEGTRGKTGGNHG